MALQSINFLLVFHDPFTKQLGIHIEIPFPFIFLLTRRLDQGHEQGSVGRPVMTSTINSIINITKACSYIMAECFCALIFR